MHWTAFLAKHRMRFNARVAGDVACIGCGYNLRGLIVGAKCPECGKMVGDSLYVLARPRVVADSLRTLAWSFLSVLAIMIGCLTSMRGWPVLLAGMIIALGCAYRFGAATRLRYFAAIDRLPMIRPRLVVLWFVITLEAVLALGVVGGIAVMMNFPGMRSNTIEQVTQGLGLGWLAATIGSMAAAGWFGAGMTSMLGYAWTRISFFVQQAAVGLAASALALAGLVIAASASGTVRSIAVMLASILLSAAVVLTWITLMQLAGATEGETEPWDEVLDAE